jgi:hypothetical protein
MKRKRTDQWIGQFVNIPNHVNLDTEPEALTDPLDLLNSYQSKDEKNDENEKKKHKKRKKTYTIVGGDSKDLVCKRIIGESEKELPFDTKGVLPKPPFRLLFIAPPHSGKTTTILNMILRRYFGYKEYFKKIVVWSPTLCQDPSWSALPDDILKDAYSKFVMDDFKKEMDEAEEDVKENGKSLDNARLFIIDDSMSSICVHGNQSTPVTDACTLGRHDNISIIYVAQCYKKLPKSIRIGGSNLGIWNVPNVKELRDVYDEHANGLSWEEFKKLCKQAWEKPYAFIHINYQCSPAKFFRSFETELQVAKKSVLDNVDENEVDKEVEK